MWSREVRMFKFKCKECNKNYKKLTKENLCAFCYQKINKKWSAGFQESKKMRKWAKNVLFAVQQNILKARKEVLVKNAVM